MKKFVSVLLAAVMAITLFSGMATASAAGMTEIPVWKMTSKFSDVEDAFIAETYKGVSDMLIKPAGSSVNCEMYYQYTLTERSIIFMEFLRGPSLAQNYCNQNAVFSVYSDAACTRLLHRTVIDKDGSQVCIKTTYGYADPGTYYLKVSSDYNYMEQEVACPYAVLIGAMNEKIGLLSAQIIEETDSYTDVKVNTNADCVGVWVQRGAVPQDQVTMPGVWTDNYKINSDTFRITNDFGIYTVRVMDQFNHCYQVYVDLTRTPPVSEIVPSVKSKKIGVGDKAFVYATVTPYNADRSVKWTSSNPKVASVKSNSTNATITGKAPGTAVITCAALDGSGKKATYKITVKPKRVVGVKLFKSGKKSIKAKWKKQKNITGYEIKFSTSAKFKKKLTKTYTLKAKTASKNFLKLKKNKEYYVKLRSYKKVGKKKLYGDYSFIHYGILY